jgi:hypothetical protein
LNNGDAEKVQNVSSVDCRTTQIKGYGAMPVSTADALEVDLRVMLGIAHRLMASLNS